MLTIDIPRSDRLLTQLCRLFLFLPPAIRFFAGGKFGSEGGGLYFFGDHVWGPLRVMLWKSRLPQSAGRVVMGREGGDIQVAAAGSSFLVLHIEESDSPVEL